MKKALVILASVFIMANAFGQNNNHKIHINTGCSLIEEAIGPQLEARYSMVFPRYFELTASLSSSNGFFYDETENHMHYTAGMYTMGIGLGGHIEFLKTVTARLLADGGMSMFSKEDSMCIRPSVGLTAEMGVRISPVFEMGLYAGKTWLLDGNSVPAASGKLGIFCAFDLN